MREKLNLATKNILEKNLELLDTHYSQKKIVLMYDEESKLSKMLGESYAENIENYPDNRIIIFDENKKQEIKDFLFTLEEDSTVILVQSTSFRLDDFRIRLNLKNAGIGCIEHNHLGYILEEQIENYIDAIEYNTPYYENLAEKLESIIEKADVGEFQTKDGNILRVEGGFEELKRNTGDYTQKYRGGMFPIGEVFTESRDFSNVNGSISIYAYPDENFQVQFCDPFVVDIKNSLLTCSDPKCPEKFRAVLDKIEAGEDGEVMVRETGFGMNTGISKEKKLSDVGAFERQCGFHMSLGKKHQIYRKKLHRKVTQRYHIDIFPDIEKITFDGEVVFEDGGYCG